MGTLLFLLAVVLLVWKVLAFLTWLLPWPVYLKWVVMSLSEDGREEESSASEKAEVDLPQFRKYY